MNKIALGFGSVAALVFGVMGSMGGCSSDDPATPTTANDGGAADAPAAKDGKAPPIAPDPVAGDDAGGGCTPGDVSSFAPKWKPPVGMHQQKCSPTQAALLASCVWDHPGRDAAACKAFLNSKAPADAACVKCGYTATSGTSLGAVVSNGTSVQVNYAGCIALTTNDLSATGCGSKVQAAALCQDEACVATCTNFKDLLACEKKAETGVCKSFTDEAACLDTAVNDGGPASICNPDTQDFGERALIYTELFCGGTTDGGADANTTDAPADAPADG